MTPRRIDIDALQQSPLPVPGVRLDAATRSLSAANATLARVADLVATDPGLTIAVLREVNAGRGARRAPIGSVDSAVNLLGQNRLLGLLRGLPRLEQACTGEALARARALWERQRLAGLLAGHWAQLREDKSPTECGVMAMCHALGEFMVCTHRPADYERIVRLQAGSQCCSEAASVRVLGLGFAAAGRVLVRAWSLPELLEDALTPARHEFYRPLCIILANELCRVAAQDWYSRATVACMESAGEYLGWSFARCSAMVHQVAVRAAREGAVDGARPLAAHLLHLPRAVAPRTQTARGGAPGPPDEARVRRQAVLLRAKQQFRGAGNRDVLGALLKALHHDFGFPRAVLFLLERDTGRLRARAAPGIGRDSPLARLSLEPAQSPLLQNLLRKPQSLLVNRENRARYDAHLPGALKQANGGLAFACMSLFANGRPLGLIYVDQAVAGDEPGADRYTDFKRLCTLANQALARPAPAAATPAQVPAPATRRAGNG